LGEEATDKRKTSLKNDKIPSNHRLTRIENYPRTKEGDPNPRDGVLLVTSTEF